MRACQAAASLGAGQGRGHAACQAVAACAGSQRCRMTLIASRQAGRPPASLPESPPPLHTTGARLQSRSTGSWRCAQSPPPCIASSRGSTGPGCFLQRTAAVIGDGWEAARCGRTRGRQATGSGDARWAGRAAAAQGRRQRDGRQAGGGSGATCAAAGSRDGGLKRSSSGVEAPKKPWLPLATRCWGASPLTYADMSSSQACRGVRVARHGEWMGLTAGQADVGR